MNRLHTAHVSVAAVLASLGTIYLGGCASELSEDSVQSQQEQEVRKCTKGSCTDAGTRADSGSDSGSASKPNVLLIVADEVAVNNVGAYKADVPGSSPPPTPTIDGLAAGGVRFRQAWANPLCSPTRATLHTGRYGFRTGVGSVVASDGSRDLPTSETTLPEMMATGGYASALVGKWHLGTSTAIGGNDAPRTAGWGYFAGGLDGALPSFTSWTRYVDGVGAKSTTYATTQNVDDALTWIGTQTGKWLATVAFNAAHDPWHMPTTGLYTSDLSTVTDCEASTENMRSCYKADIEAMDSEIARLLKGIDLTTTMVIFVGDNGTPSEVVDDGYDSTRAKGTVYQGGVLVPLIISGPQVKTGGRVIDDPVNLTDVFATIGEIGGVTTTTGTDSHSLMPYIARTKTSPRAYAYTEVFTGTTPDSAGGSAAIRDAQYKVIESAGTMTECYDLINDAWETTNLITATSTPAACTTLYAQMTALR